MAHHPRDRPPYLGQARGRPCPEGPRYWSTLRLLICLDCASMGGPMTCAVLCIGTELTRGELVNTNAAFLASGLTDVGFEVIEDVVIDDDKTRIIATLQRLTRST